MIAYASTAESFTDLGRYLRTDKVDAQKSRVAWAHEFNLPSSDVVDAAECMHLIAYTNVRVQKPVYHVMVTWGTDEAPSRAQMKAVAEGLLSDLALTEHQAILVQHEDRPHPHFHLMVNRIHPDTKELWSDSFDWPRIERSLRRLEHEHGFRSTPGTLAPTPDGQYRDYSQASPLGARRARHRTGKPSVLEHAREALRPAFEQAFNWIDLESRLAREGYTLERRPRGLVAVRDGRGISVSRISNVASLPKLEKRYGISFADHRSRHPARIIAPSRADGATHRNSSGAALGVEPGAASGLPTAAGAGSRPDLSRDSGPRDNAGRSARAPQGGPRLGDPLSIAAADRAGGPRPTATDRNGGPLAAGDGERDRLAHESAGGTLRHNAPTARQPNGGATGGHGDVARADSDRTQRTGRRPEQRGRGEPPVAAGDPQHRTTGDERHRATAPTLRPAHDRHLGAAQGHAQRSAHDDQQLHAAQSPDLGRDGARSRDRRAADGLLQGPILDVERAAGHGAAHRIGGAAHLPERYRRGPGRDTPHHELEGAALSDAAFHAEEAPAGWLLHDREAGAHYFLRSQAVAERWARLLTERPWTDAEMAEHRARLSRMGGAAERQLVAEAHQTIRDRLIEAARPFYRDPEKVPDRITHLLKTFADDYVRSRIDERPDIIARMRPEHAHEMSWVPLERRYRGEPYAPLREASHAWADAVQGKPVPLPSFTPLAVAARGLATATRALDSERRTPGVPLPRGIGL